MVEKEEINIEEFIEEITKVRPEVLTLEAKALYKNIMKILDENLILKKALKDKCEIADERNQLLVENQNKYNTIKNLEGRNRKLDMENQKLFEQSLFQDKVIDEMAEFMSTDYCIPIPKEECRIGEATPEKCEHCIKQYFIKKVEEQE